MPEAGGHELLSLWGPVYGTATYVGPTQFSLTGTDIASLYEPGMPVQRIYDAGTAYSTIASTNFGTAIGAGGTVTLRDAILGTPIGTVSLAGDYLIEYNRYKYIGAGGTTPLTTLRLIPQFDRPIVSRVSDPAYANPVNCMRYVLTDPDLGLGGSVIDTNWNVFAIVASLNGLGSAVSGVLGGDKAQRRAIDVLDELAMMRGIRIWKDADTNAWDITMDYRPADPVMTLSYGPSASGTAPSPNNVRAVREIRTTPLADAVSVLKLKYAKSWADRGVKPLEEVEYDYTASMNVLDVGSEHTIVSPWIREHEPAARMLYYIGKRLQREDRKIVVEMGNEARRLGLGDLVNVDLQISAAARITGTYRIIQRERVLTTFILTLAGYNADIYETNYATILNDVNQPAGDVNPDERGTNPGTDANLILNSDWSAGLTRTAPTGLIDTETIPDWSIGFPGGLSSLRVVQSPQAKGGSYLEVVRAASPLANTIFAVADSTTSDPYDGALSVVGGTNYHLSMYADRADAWRFEITWYTAGTVLISTGAGTPTRKVNPGDVNGFGWKRYYSTITAPADAAFGWPSIELSGSSTTHRFDALQFEEVTRITLRPSPWKRNARYGIRPSRLTPGDLMVRAAGRVEHGTRVSAGTATPHALSGASTVAVGTAQAGVVTGVTGRVHATITGVSNWTLAFHHGGGTLTSIGTAMSTGVGIFSTDSLLTRRLGFPITFGSAVPIVAIGTANFTGGTVSCAAHSLQHTAREA